MAFSRRVFLQSAGGLAVGMSSTGFAIGSPPRYAGTEPTGGKVVRLNSNENAYGPSSGVKAEIQKAMGSVNRYPASRQKLIGSIAQAHKVDVKQIVLGSGSTEVIRAVAASMLGPGKSVVVASPTYEAMSQYAQLYGAQVFSVPLNHEFAHDLEAMRARVDANTSVVYICNPNNPTASITPRKSIEEFLGQLPKGIVVVIDEAYHHFAPQSTMYQSFLDYPIPNDRLVVLRTFSRLYGLAGLRVGYAVTSSAIAQQTQRHIEENGISEVGLLAANASLEDQEGLHLAVKRNADDRQEFFNQAMARMLKPIDSKTNFVLMDVHHPAAEIIEHFRSNNVLIGRLFPPLNTHIRVSFGTREEMHEFWRVWDLLPFSHGMRM
jgi:histidinol-phosphate aminotransferase